MNCTDNDYRLEVELELVMYVPHDAGQAPMLSSTKP